MLPVILNRFLEGIAASCQMKLCECLIVVLQSAEVVLVNGGGPFSRESAAELRFQFESDLGCLLPDRADLLQEIL